jgi:ubiquinone/menaquinone biosynthesis C-methylase UbiE
MANNFADRPIGEHDWHSREYVDQWIRRDVTRDGERRPLLRHMLSTTPFASEAEVNVLDVGAGYGLLSEEVMRAYPRAHITLLDYSEPMFEHARRRLAAAGKNASYLLADLTEPDWAAKAGGPFDLAVSGLAIHNLGSELLMKACYRSVQRVLKPGGIFLDYDLFGLVSGGVDTHMQWLREAAFEKTQCSWEQAPVAIIAAWAASK